MRVLGCAATFWHVFVIDPSPLSGFDLTPNTTVRGPAWRPGGSPRTAPSNRLDAGPGTLCMFPEVVVKCAG